MEVIVRNLRFEDLFRTKEFYLGECVGMPCTRPNEEQEEGNIYSYNGYVFCESNDSWDFFIGKMTYTSDQFTDSDCQYIRESKGLNACEEVTDIDAYITGFGTKQSPIKVIYDSKDDSVFQLIEVKNAIDILNTFAIDNVERQIEVTLDGNNIKISDIKE